MKEKLKETITLMLPILFHIENIYLSIYFFQKMSGNTYFVVLGILFLILEIRYLIFTFKILIMGKSLLQSQLKSNKTIGVSGSQGKGKTSLCFLIASILKSKVYCNIPVIIKNIFVYKFKEDILNWEKKPFENSLLIFDEISLFYQNLKVKNERKAEMFLQLIRHAIGNGANFICNSVSIDRIPKQIEEKLSTFFKILRQYTYYPTISSYLFKMFKINLNFRVWHYLKLDTIDIENYNYDLSNTKNDKYKFVESNSVCCFNLFPKFKYNDRYYSTLFENVDISKEKYKSLNMTEEDKKSILDKLLNDNKKEAKTTTTYWRAKK